MAGLYRKILKITASMSPNVRLALKQIEMGVPVTNEILVPGVISWEEYQRRRATWDIERQTVGLDAEFYEGAELRLFPLEWRQRANQIAAGLRGRTRKVLAVGLDPGEGVSNTSMCAVDEHGIIEMVSWKTPDTGVIINHFIAFIDKHKVDPHDALIDRGAGKTIADIIRSKGYPVRTVAFGEGLALPPKHGIYLPRYRKKIQEERYAYTNRRAQMYGDFSNLLDPSINEDGFGIPIEYYELDRQMAPIPKYRDPEGRLIIPPKNPRPGAKSATIKSLKEIIGHSPDELDSLVLAVHGLLYSEKPKVAGTIW